ncbi:uncharacterized protein MYCFIDRAFT_179914 [Pseudocercospora fijiensis CIRAD86]|uniref:Uncharacterized protein n=1 Tax=Pseudocercospora fijiensis (strain CIRAD86) TaxID=383855 RepID=M2ZDZ9_PSEFD|nr:uncharacterized protein MYCFIDRAFT_179914 [Pseudocercospora fijiensis CIRAD86]EME77339.1 hypothetical protein MYCFIDRAFT_179914 [Pseudocercospora fijiensis CIRAD86]
MKTDENEEEAAHNPRQDFGNIRCGQSKINLSFQQSYGRIHHVAPRDSPPPAKATHSRQVPH